MAEEEEEEEEEEDVTGSFGSVYLEDDAVEEVREAGAGGKDDDDDDDAGDKDEIEAREPVEMGPVASSTLRRGTDEDEAEAAVAVDVVGADDCLFLLKKSSEGSAARRNRRDIQERIKSR